MALLKDKKLIYGGAAAVVVLLLALFTTREKEVTVEYKVEQGPFLPDLQGNVENVETIVIQSKGGSLRVVRENGQWILPNRHNYPVDLETIRKVVLNAEKLTIVEKKTSDKERLKVLGLGDVEDKEGQAARVLMTDVGGQKVYADFVKGVPRRSGRVGEEDALYVRYWNDDQAWLVTGDFDLRLDANGLLMPHSYRIAASRAKSIEVHPPLEETFKLSRINVDHDFKFDLPAGMEANVNTDVNNLGMMLDGALVFEDVLPQADKPFDKKLVTTHIFETYDGLRITLETLRLNDGDWVRLSADTASDSKKEEVAAINAVAKEWVYKVSQPSGDMLAKTLEQLKKQPEKKKSTAQ